MKLFPEKFPAGTQGTITAGYYMNERLNKTLSRYKEVAPKNWDFTLIIDGAEGSGKSTLAQQCAFFLDPTLSLDRVCFSADQFKTAVLNSKRYQSIIFDEAYNDLSSKEATTTVSKQITSMMTQIRRKNLFIFVVLPTFFDLNRYMAVHRANILVHVYTKNYERGQFRVYRKSSIKYMYLMGKKSYDYSISNPDYYGRFTEFWLVDKQAYEDKKDKAFEELTKDDKDSKVKNTKSPQDIKSEYRDEITIKQIKKMLALGVSKKDIESYLNISTNYYYKLMTKSKIIDNQLK